jgi:DNA-binding IscR family transcriptional regulator
MAIPAAQLEDALGHLADAGLVSRQPRNAWQLARAPGDITLRELHRAMGAPGLHLEPEDWSGYPAEVVDVMNRFDGLLDRPLTVLLAAREPPASGR